MDTKLYHFLKEYFKATDRKEFLEEQGIIRELWPRLQAEINKIYSYVQDHYGGSISKALSDGCGYALREILKDNDLRVSKKKQSHYFDKINHTKKIEIDFNALQDYINNNYLGWYKGKHVLEIMKALPLLFKTKRTTRAIRIWIKKHKIEIPN